MRIGDAYVEPLRWWERVRCAYLDTARYVRCWYLTWQWRRAKIKRTVIPYQDGFIADDPIIG